MDTRIYFATDIHGSEVCFKKFVKAAKFYSANIIIMGGDTTGKVIVPIIHVDGVYQSLFINEDAFLTKSEIEEHDKIIRNSGYYPVYFSKEEYLSIKDDPDKIHELFISEMVNTTKRWVKFAEKELADNVKCIIAPGNDDELIIDEIIKESKRIIYGEDQVIYLDDDHEMLSVGWTNPTPWNTIRECTEEEIEARINRLIPKVNNMKNCVFNLHAPPYGTGLDVAPELSNGDKLVRGGHVKKSVGSHAVLNVIQKYQPLLSLHGHIHESKAVLMIGRTLCINPGSMYGDAVLCGAIIDINKKGIKGYFTTTG